MFLFSTLESAINIPIIVSVRGFNLIKLVPSMDFLITAGKCEVVWIISLLFATSTITLLVERNSIPRIPSSGIGNRVPTI